MFAYQRRRYEMFLRVQDFILAHAALFPPASVAGVIFAALQAAITAIADLAGEQISVKGGLDMAADGKGEARDALYVMLKEINGMARSLAYVVSGLENKFRIPYSLSDRNLIAAGRAFAKDAVDYQAQFVELGLDDNFIEHLTAATDAFEQAMAEADTAEQSKVGSTASFAPHIQAGMIAVRRLDPMVKRMFRSDAAALSAWTFAKHVERAPQAKPPSQPSLLN